MFKWRRIIVLAVLAVCLAFLVLVGSLYFRQHSMLYHPRPYDASYADPLPHDRAELHFTTIAAKQVAFYLPAESTDRLPKRIWVAFCGNGSLALDWAWLQAQDRQSRDAFLLIDYPGYGKSEGYATIATTRAAADNALDALAAHLGVNEREIESRLDVIGHSLGTAVALDFATHHPVGHVILISVFTTLREEAATIFGGPFHICLSKITITAPLCANLRAARRCQRSTSSTALMTTRFQFAWAASSPKTFLRW